MKFFFFISFFAIISCKTTSSRSSKDLTIIKSTSFCPEDGKCNLSIKNNKQLIIKSDDIGKQYYELVDNNSKSVIIYEYSRNTPKDLQDASYREEIIFEIENSTNSLTLSNENLGNTKMLFGRHCFCRGQAGYYPVKKGNLKLTNEKSKITFSLNFEIDEVPQIIKMIQNKSPN